MWTALIAPLFLRDFSPVCTLFRQSFQCDIEAGSEGIHPAKVAILRAMAQLVPLMQLFDSGFNDFEKIF